jgi:hypothetical protein
VSERAKTVHALGRAATVIGQVITQHCINSTDLFSAMTKHLQGMSQEGDVEHTESSGRSSHIETNKKNFSHGHIYEQQICLARHIKRSFHRLCEKKNADIF